MSKLIHSAQKEASVDDASSLSSEALPQSKVVVLVKACQHVCNDIVQDAITDFLSHFDQALDQAMDQATSNQQVQDVIHAQREFRRAQASIKKLFCFQISEGFNKFSRKELSTYLEDPRQESQSEQLSSLAIVDDETLNESIALSSVLLKTQLECKESLWVLNHRFAVLNDGESVNSHNNPVSPVQFCMAFKKAFIDVDLNTQARSLAYSVFAEHCARLCQTVIDRTNAYLKTQRVLPYLSQSAYHRLNKPSIKKNTLAPGQQVNPFQSEVAFSPEESARNQEKMMAAIRRLQEAASIQLPLAAQYIESNQVLDGIKHVQSFSAQGLVEATANYTRGEPVNILPFDMARYQAMLTQQLQISEGKRLDNVSAETIDLVGRVFSFMLSDDGLPSQVKALLSHLHTPFLKIAFLDAKFFEQVEHPARELLDNLAEAASEAISENAIVDVKTFEKIQSAVNVIVSDFDNDLRLITEELIGFKRFIKSNKHRQALAERRTTEKIKGEEKLKAVKARVNTYIQSKTASKDLPSAVLLFLLQPWSDYLCFVLLRHGDKSEQWLDAVELVDDVLWAINSYHSEEDKLKQKALMASLLKRIDAALQTIAYDSEQAQKFLKAMQFIVSHAIDNRIAQPASAQVKEKIQKKAASKAGNVEVQAPKLPSEVKKMVDNLKFLEFGSWFEFNSGQRLKLAWYNKRMKNYLFVDQTGRKVELISNIDMAYGLIKKNIKLIPGSSKPFFERALESIYKQLNAEQIKDSE